MTNKQANFCCDCEYAKKTGFIFKTWRCTNEEVNKAHLTGGNFEYDTCPATAKAINKQGSKRFIACNEARDKFHSLRFWVDIDDNHGIIHHCKFYKGEYRRHPAIPPVKNRLPVPPKAIKTNSQVADSSD